MVWWARSSVALSTPLVLTYHFVLFNNPMYVRRIFQQGCNIQQVLTSLTLWVERTYLSTRYKSWTWTLWRIEWIYIYGNLCTEYGFKEVTLWIERSDFLKRFCRNIFPGSVYRKFGICSGILISVLTKMSKCVLWVYFFSFFSSYMIWNTYLWN